MSLSFLFSVLILSASAQLAMVDKVKDFGILRRADPNWVDFEIRNSGSADAVIFRVEGPKNTDIKLSAKTVIAGKSEFIRVAVSPKAEGKFSIDLAVHASPWAKPEMIEIKGESTFAASSLIPCPDFGSNTAANDNQFHISVRELIKNIPVEEAEIAVYKDGRKIDNLSTNQHGEVSAQLPYGRYFFSIQHNGFQMDTALYVNAVNSHLLAMLEAKEIIYEEAIKEYVIEDEEVALEEEEIEIPVEPKPLSTPTVEQTPRDIPIPVEPENSVLPLSGFKQNNLVFLVDVSTSMKKDGKLDLLKIAMVELLDVLRPVDRFSLISYSNETNVIIETESNLDRDACIAAILALEPGGGTAGAKAINKAGSVAMSHFVDNGNNQIILATDGAFNEGVDKAMNYTSKYKRKNIQLSVLGIKCGPFTTKQMNQLVDEGGGRFVAVNQASDAGNQLIDEIKKSSVR
ncbi:VWA domain-containing protein [Cryomorpha ignava]|uniref:VWA domain-containing protein n=1 Tax=Cryomorpha ignava TaxID=101383 RepID=A0A7K3WS84_9FLAO|nr:VWA domain-containing protein [Cryomorpha ignava]NEN24533.1 VWA domain-containing protein [Cryomorpha ignava]